VPAEYQHEAMRSVLEDPFCKARISVVEAAHVQLKLPLGLGLT
jgi:hypothetical protein